VRLSILAAAYADTPYTLMQISQTPRSINPLADGAGHTFLKVSFSLSKNVHSVPWATLTPRSASSALSSSIPKLGS